MLAPPTAMHSASPSVLAASWTILRETLLASGFADRASKEAVATGVSEANSCPYCADVHGMTLDAIPSAEPGELISWARSSATGPVALPCAPDQAPELIGVAVAFHYYNRVVNLFLSESPFPSHVPESANPKARKVLGGVLRPTATGPAPGESVDVLPAAALTDDLWWAAPHRVVATAFARAYAAIEAAGARSVPASVRSLVLGRLSVWDGTPPGLSRSWVDAPVATLPVAEQAAGRLALTIALASYQVDDEMVAAFRRTAPDDATLLELASWSSLAAARRISTWLAEARPAAA
jgi:AhpD family alkylhydroperoxidase